MRVLKILQNPKAPLVKKRQVMRTTFGDYRKKMADEEQRCVSSEYGEITESERKMIIILSSYY